MTWEAAFQSAIGLIITIMFYFVTAYLRMKISAIKDEQIRAMAQVAVDSIEMTLTNKAKSEGKYDAAKLQLQALLAKKGIKLDDVTLHAYIEAAVLKLQPTVILE